MSRQRAWGQSGGLRPSWADHVCSRSVFRGVWPMGRPPPGLIFLVLILFQLLLFCLCGGAAGITFSGIPPGGRSACQVGEPIDDLGPVCLAR